MMSEIKSPYAAKPWLGHYDYWVPTSMNYPRRPLHEILRITANNLPGAKATAFLNTHLTYSEVKEQSEVFATALARQGIVKGDRIGIMLPNCPQYLIAVFAVLRLGAIVVNVNPLYTPREVLIVAKDSGMRVLLTLDALAPVAIAIRDQTSIETLIITALGDYSGSRVHAHSVENTVRWADLLAKVESEGGVDLPSVDIDPEKDVAVLQYTGGTTGVPKGAMLTHYNIFANVVQCEAFLDRYIRRGEDAHLHVIPYFHIYGLTVGLFFATWLGVQQVMIPKYDVDAVLVAIHHYQPAYFPAVPTIYISLLNHPKAREYGIGKVRIFNSGSAPLPVEVIDQFERMTGGTLNEGYGLSEASPVTHSTPLLARRKPGSIGLPFPDTEIKIVDLETGMREVAVGSEGELCIAGPQVMKGYWNRPDETAIALR
ncbi:MAG: AMP-binding protein, partial [Pyrinomonadaceae bacterium]|nr:AMP-binding protein [Pyrinomonadaceae bacterium]